MEVNRSLLISAIRPYLRVFSIFSITPPIECFQKSSRRFRYLLAGYACYVLVMFFIVVYECYINMAALHMELEDFKVGDFSIFMGDTQKIVIALAFLCNTLNMLAQFRRLGGIFEDIADLEKEVDKALQQFGVQRDLKKFRLRLALGLGWWMCCCILGIPYLTHMALGPYVKGPNKIFTQIILVIIQLKSHEYCVFVILMGEFVRRLRKCLLKIQEELLDCEDAEMLRVLCVGLRKNQTLVGRVWHLAEEISGYFSFSMIFQFLYNGLTILHVVNWAYIKQYISNDGMKYLRAFRCFFLLSNVLIVSIHSDCCVKTYNKKIPRLLHQISGLPIASNCSMLKMGLREYILQMQHLKLHFTCAGFFDINLKHFAGMVVTIYGYIIILLQFKIQTIAEEKYKSIYNSSDKY